MASPSSMAQPASPVTPSSVPPSASPASGPAVVAVAIHEAPLGATGTAWARLWSKSLNDPRDIVFINLSAAMTLTLLPAAVGLFVLGASGQWNWWWAPLYWGFLGVVFMDRFILMLHCVSHRPLFQRKYRFFNNYIPWVLGPLVGETPEAYFVHHIGMHHKEANLSGDLSTTMPFRRDKFSNWLKYWGRFMTIGLFDLGRYHARKGNDKLLKRLIIGEGSFWIGTILLAALVSLQATLVVFWIPVAVIRTLMMAGNWGQHAFVDPAAPDNDFKSAITCINTRYNRRCFNDGYHIIHHLKPSLHYSEMADEFHKNRELYGKNDAIVFEGVDFFQVWLLLMTGQKKTLARAFVRLPGAPERSEADVLALIERRMAPFA